MSVVTNIILVCSVSDSEYTYEGERRLMPPMRTLLDWCTGQRSMRNEPDQITDGIVGGPKNLEVGCYAWGGNYLVLDDFLDVVRTAPWRFPASVQVFVKEQNDELFSVYNLTHDRQWERWPASGDGS